MNVIQTMGIASSLAGNHDGCREGPAKLRDSKYIQTNLEGNGLKLRWFPLLEADSSLSNDLAIQKLCAQAASASSSFVQSKQPFIFFAGEHAYAMGIWRGVMSALKSKRLGLIWIDAHMDAHTFVSSPSGNVHGMPVSALLGKGDKRLSKIYGEGPYIGARNLALMGIRSFERGESALLKGLGIHNIEMKDISPSNLRGVLSGLKEYVLQYSDYFAFSLDIDAIDPKDAPGVGVPEPGGLCGKSLCKALRQFNNDPLMLGVEIAEFSPQFDKDDKTLRLISELIISLYGEL